MYVILLFVRSLPSEIGSLCHQMLLQEEDNGNDGGDGGSDEVERKIKCQHTFNL